MSDNFRSKIVLSPGAPQVSSTGWPWNLGLHSGGNVAGETPVHPGTAGEGLVPKLPCGQGSRPLCGPRGSPFRQQLSEPLEQNSVAGEPVPGQGPFLETGKTLEF